MDNIGFLNLSEILAEVGLSHKTDTFLREEVTVDDIRELSHEELVDLGVTHEDHRRIIEELDKRSGEFWQIIGRPSLDIKKETLQTLLDDFFTINEIAKILLVSERSVYRYMKKYDLSKRSFTDISDSDLDFFILDIYRAYPNCGEKLMASHLSAVHKITVPRQRLRERIHVIDPEGVAERKKKAIKRRIYNVESANSLWHIDGNHKLIRWNFVIHGAVDGYSRLPVFLRCSTDNKAETVLTYFKEAVSNHGWPDRVRTDKGGENVGVAQCMVEKHGTGRGAALVGKSTHNQRIERLWRDVFPGALQRYHEVFSTMEELGHLNILNEVHIFALHYVFKPRINKSLDEWTQAWSHHKLRTARETPWQLWIKSQVRKLNTCDDAENYGTEDLADNVEVDVEEEGVVVPTFDIPLDEAGYELLTQFRPLDSETGIDVYLGVLEFIDDHNSA